jgi:hypothetical protein
MYGIEVEVNDKIPPVNTFCPDPVNRRLSDYLDELDSYIQAEDYSVLEQYGTASLLTTAILDITNIQ